MEAKTADVQDPVVIYIPAPEMAVEHREPKKINRIWGVPFLLILNLLGLG